MFVTNNISSLVSIWIRVQGFSAFIYQANASMWEKSFKMFCNEWLNHAAILFFEMWHIFEISLVCGASIFWGALLISISMSSLVVLYPGWVLARGRSVWWLLNFRVDYTLALWCINILVRIHVVWWPGWLERGVEGHEYAPGGSGGSLTSHTPPWRHHPTQIQTQIQTQTQTQKQTQTQVHKHERWRCLHQQQQRKLVILDDMF